MQDLKIFAKGGRRVADFEEMVNNSTEKYRVMGTPTIHRLKETPDSWMSYAGRALAWTKSIALLGFEALFLFISSMSPFSRPRLERANEQMDWERRRRREHGI